MKSKWTLVLAAAIALGLGVGGAGVAAAQEASGPPGTAHRYLGIVKDVKGQTIDLRTRHGEKHVLTNQDTVFRYPRRPATLDDVHAGDILLVRGTPTGGDNVKADTVVVVPLRVVCERFPRICQAITGATADASTPATAP